MKKIFLVPLLFLFVATATLSDYGINWDEPFHFNRGQAYLRYLLIGKKNYLDMPMNPPMKGSSDFMGREGESELFKNAQFSNIPSDPNSRRSYFQSDVFNFEYFIKYDGYGHPPINGILSAATNYFLYQKIPILGDVEAYHFFEVVTAFLLVLTVSVFTYKLFGIFPSMVAALSLAAYPLFFAEAHFNIKDPPLAAFFGIAIISFYFGIAKKNWRLILLSAVSCTLAFGTKFNAVFLPFIIAPWFLLYLLQKKKNSLNKKLLISMIIYPAVVLGIFFALWPYLWDAPLHHLSQMVQFYKDIGTAATDETQKFLLGPFNSFAVYWIAITTPLPILILSIIGVVISLYRLIKKHQHVYLLILLWFFIPILRVSFSSTSLTGGIRQILEFLPAMAILSGIGAHVLVKKYKTIALVSISLSFIFVIWEVGRLHPNENVYFNQLVGGLAGAKEKKIPYWGYNYGNIYLQGVEWLNENAEPNAKLSLAVMNMVNVPRIRLRPDIDFSNAHLSADAHQGEYVMEMAHNWQANNWYSYRYYDKNLNPIHEIKIDGVTLLKIWKNDKSFLKSSPISSTQHKVINQKIVDGTLTLDLGKQIYLNKLSIAHDDESCSKQKGGYIRLSMDSKTWIQQSETIDYPQMPTTLLGIDSKNFVYVFTNEPTQYIFLDTQMKDSCLLKNPKISVFGFTK